MKISGPSTLKVLSFSSAISSDSYSSSVPEVFPDSDLILIDRAWIGGTGDALDLGSAVSVGSWLPLMPIVDCRDLLEGSCRDCPADSSLIYSSAVVGLDLDVSAGGGRNEIRYVLMSSGFLCGYLLLTSFSERVSTASLTACNDLGPSWGSCS